MADLATTGDGSKHVSSEEIVAELYAELRQLAAAKMARVAEGQTFQATALVHEAYLRLVKDPSQRWANRSHFFAAAAEAMRRILVEQARRKAAIRHGGGIVREPRRTDPGCVRGLRSFDPERLQHPLKRGDGGA